jgi:hypothetical protein
MSPVFAALGVAALAALIKIAFFFAIRADERLEREEKARKTRAPRASLTPDHDQ